MRIENLAALFLVCSLPAQLFVVDPLGRGTHTDLQAAINAAPAGAVIEVRGGTYGPLLVTRTVTILGKNTPHVRAPYTGIGQQPPAISLQGTGSETAVLSGLDVSGLCSGSWWNLAGPGIASTGFRRLAIFDSVVRGHEWVQATGTAQSASAIVASGAAALHIVRSVVAGTQSDSGGANTWAPSGAIGINASSAWVTLLASTVTGGSAGSTYWYGPPAGPCPCPGFPGSGGVGVSAWATYAAGSTIAGGHGSQVTSYPGSTPWGMQPAGAPIVATASTTVAATLAQTAPLRLGTVHSIGFAPSNALSLLLVGSPAPGPTSVVGVQFVAIDLAQPIVLEFVPATATSWSLALPLIAGLLGLELAEQRFDFTPSGSWVATNPVFGVVVP